MTRSTISLSLRALFAVSALATAGFAVGCANEVVSGGSEGTQQGEGAAGGSATSDADKPCQPGTQRPCSLANGEPGLESCYLGSDEQHPPSWSSCEASSSTFSTPLVLSFGRAPVRFEAGMHGAAFDLSGVMSVATDWPAAETPWLVLDRNGDGRINDGAELFGSATVLASGERAPNGFVALRELDDNGDGRIDAQDPAFARLALWSDRDGDRISQAGELEGLAARRLLAIDLAFTAAAPRCDARGNCEIERAAFRYLDEAGVERAGEIIDVYLRHR